jgi:hypothetical protein
MTNLEMLLPFALPPAEHAKDLLAQLQLPSLAKLLAHANKGEQQVSEPFAPALPHEQWLAGAKTDNSPPIAKTAMQLFGMTEPGNWFLLQPASLHIARDHLVLTDRRQLKLSETESRALFDAALPFINESGFALRYGDAGNWFLRADVWQTLRTCTPDAACGHNIDIWMPQGEGERAWRKLLNELQMLWHTHAVNEAREARGAHRINSAWLWGAATVEANEQRALALQAINHPQDPVTSRHVLDSLIAPALAGDWSAWLSTLTQLEENFAAHLKDLQQGRIDSITLVLSDSSRLQTWRTTRASMRKFWLTSSLARLAA